MTMFKLKITVPGSPRNVRLLDVNQTAFSVGWDSPSVSNGQILEYRVSYTEPGTPNTERSFTVPARPGDQMLVVSGLRPATTVEVRVGYVIDLVYGYTHTICKLGRKENHVLGDLFT